jgi:hypothetical protein
MRTFLKVSPVALLFVFLLVPSAEARADTVAITVTGGFINFTPNLVNNSFSLTGNGLSIQGKTRFFFLGGTSPDSNFTGAKLGRILDNDDFVISTPFTVGGSVYPIWQNMDDAIFLNITADEFAFPVDPSITSATFTSTFTLNGSMLVHHWESPDPIPGRTALLTGQGVVTAVYTHGPFAPNLWQLQSLTYTFQATPTPEPSALLLLMTGLGGAAAKVYRGRKADNRKERG